MNGERAPHPDRWLIGPTSFYEALRVSAPSWSELARLRFDSGQVEPLEPETLAEQATPLLRAGWSQLRLIVGIADAEWRERYDKALAALVDQLPAELWPRVRLHEEAMDPQECRATLAAPEEAILRRWLDDGRPRLPTLDAVSQGAGWADRYGVAFDQWRRAAEFHYGESVFDDLADLHDLAGTPTQGAHALLARQEVETFDFAANEPTYKIRAGRGAMRSGSSDDEPMRLYGRWFGPVREAPVTIEAFGRAAVGADMRIVVRIDATDAPKPVLSILALELRDAQDRLIGTAAWDGVTLSGGALAVAHAELANADDALLDSIRAGGVRVRLTVGTDIR